MISKMHLGTISLLLFCCSSEPSNKFQIEEVADLENVYIERGAQEAKSWPKIIPEEAMAEPPKKEDPPKEKPPEEKPKSKKKKPSKDAQKKKKELLKRLEDLEDDLEDMPQQQKSR